MALRRQYNPQGKIQSQQWLLWSRSGPVKAKSELLRQKVMATVFWDTEGILLVDFLKNKKTITFAYQEDVLRKLSKKILETPLASCINVSSSTTTVHPLMVLGKQELCYVNFKGKSSNIPFTTLILPHPTSFCFQS